MAPAESGHYESLVAELEAAPITWVLGLLSVLVRRARKHVFAADADLLVYIHRIIS